MHQTLTNYSTICISYWACSGGYQIQNKFIGMVKFMDLAEQYILFALIFVWEFLWSRGLYWITIHFAPHSEVCLLPAPHRPVASTSHPRHPSLVSGVWARAAVVTCFRLCKYHCVQCPVSTKLRESFHNIIFGEDPYYRATSLIALPSNFTLNTLCND